VTYAGDGWNQEESIEFHSRRCFLVCQEAIKQGLHALPYWYDRQHAFACTPILDGLVDGIIAGTPHLDIVEILRKRAPLVLMDVPFSPDISRTPVVNVDVQWAVHQLLQHLRELGHDRIGFFRVDTKINPCVAPLCAHLQETLDRCGISLHPAFQRSYAITPEKHDEMMTEFAQIVLPLAQRREISAVVCPSDVHAVTLIQKLQALGLSVPQDLSVTGFGSAFEADHGSASLHVTGIRYPWAALIAGAVRLLAATLKQSQEMFEQVLVKPEFVVGSSTGAPPGKPPTAG
jgi:DNA-binding LacI/PurR family transcriptional regulator